MGDHAARLLWRGIKALKFNRPQKPTEGAKPTHHRYWTQYLLLAGTIVLILALAESLLKLK